MIEGIYRESLMRKIVAPGWIQLLCFKMKPPPPHSGSKWHKTAKNNKLTWCDFTSFSQAKLSRFTIFPFPTNVCTSYWKLVKLLLALVWPVNFTSFWIFGGILLLGPTVRRRHCKTKRKEPLHCRHSFAAAVVLSPSIILQYILLA